MRASDTCRAKLSIIQLGGGHCHQLIIHAKLIANLEAGVKTCLHV